MSYISTFRMLSALALCVAVVGGCGVKSAPQHPEGSRYPGIYPAAEDTVPARRAPSQSRIPNQPRPADRSRPTNEAVPAPTNGIYTYPNPPTYRPPKN